MTKKIVVFSVGILAVAAIATTALVYANADMEKNEVKSVIKSAYLNGAFNDLDTESMAKGFHPVFKIHGVKDGELQEYPIADWIKSIEKRKASPDFKPEDQKWDYKFAYVDVTGVAASAKIELSKDGKHIYTDYLSLLKFKDGWKITDKVYFRHADTD
jgi:hypothetical protein